MVTNLFFVEGGGSYLAERLSVPYEEMCFMNCIFRLMVSTYMISEEHGLDGRDSITGWGRVLPFHNRLAVGPTCLPPLRKQRESIFYQYFKSSCFI